MKISSSMSEGEGLTSCREFLLAKGRQMNKKNRSMSMVKIPCSKGWRGEYRRGFMLSPALFLQANNLTPLALPSLCKRLFLGVSTWRYPVKISAFEEYYHPYSLYHWLTISLNLPRLSLPNCFSQSRRIKISSKIGVPLSPTLHIIIS